MLDSDEMERTVADLYRDGENPIGCSAPEIEFEAIDYDPEADIPAPDMPEVDPRKEFDCLPFPYADLLRCEPVDVPELVPGLIQKNIATFFDGAGGLHKSRVVMQIGLCVDAGKPVWGRQTEKAKFVHLGSEDDRNEIIRRAHAITRRLALPDNPSAVFWDRKDQDSALARVKEDGQIELLPFHTALVTYLKSIPGHKLVAVDSWYDFVRFVGGARIDEDSVNGLIKRVLGAICASCNCSMIVIRHPSRAGIERGDMTSYSVANENAPRARLSMRAGDGDSFVLKVEKRNHGPRGEEIVLFWNDGVLEPFGEMQEDAQDSRLQQAVVTMATEAAERGRPLNRKAAPTDRQLRRVAKLLDKKSVRPKTVRDELERASEIGGPLKYISADGRHVGGYFPAEKADELSRVLKKSGADTGADAGAD
jgi:hypothetical protein